MKKQAILICFTVLFLISTSSSRTQATSSFRVGTGIYDITGPSAEVVFMGFALMEQKGEGIHMRLWSRAYIVEDSDNNVCVIVSADVGWISQAVKQAVVKKLESAYGDRYTTKNVLIQAQHTHSGPGGYTHYFTYNVPTMGFIEQNFNAVTDGIYRSIVRAHNNLAPGKIFVNQGRLEQCGMNRSEEAYDNNIDSNLFPEKMDKIMTLLKFERDDGTPVGSINWFPIHPTTLGVFNKLVSGDNKGMASYLFEKAMGTDYRSGDTFVAAFAQSNSGDVSPNVQFTGSEPDPEGAKDYEHLGIIGDMQYQKAIQLFDTATTELSGKVEYAHEHVNFANLPIEGMDCETCEAAHGSAFAAGSTEDGFSPAPIWPEGFTTNDIDYSEDFSKAFLADLLPVIFPIFWPTLTDEFKACHEPKPILFPNGIMTFENDDEGVKIPALPEILPMQIVKLGELVLIAPPSEITTMAGRRLMKTVADKFGDDGNFYVTAALSNAYIGYVTTKEEYDMQHYEGGHNQFGPNALYAYQQEFGKLADSIVTGIPLPDGPTPREIGHLQKTLHTGVVWDGKLLFEKFGQIFDEDDKENYDAEDSYQRGDTVRVSFVGGHPNNNLMTQGTYLEVKRIMDMTESGDNEQISSDTIVARDNDPETKFIWVRHHTDRSRIDIEWVIPEATIPGRYQITHYGYWKNGNPFSSTYKKTIPYQGSSRVFTVIE